MRELQKKFRIVVTGDSRGIHNAWAEYRVVDGNMFENPCKLEFDELDENKSVNTIWMEAVSLIKEHEKI